MRKNKRRYTFILDHCGGTYIAQVSASNLKRAFKRWYKELVRCDIPDALQIVTAFDQSGDCGDPTPITGLKKVWCSTAQVGESFTIVNIVCC